MTDILIEGSDDEPSLQCLSPSPSLPIVSLGAFPFLTSARMGGLGVLDGLRIEVFLDMLVEISPWGSERGSISLRDFDSFSVIIVVPRRTSARSPISLSLDFARNARLYS